MFILNSLEMKSIMFAKGLKSLKFLTKYKVFIGQMIQPYFLFPLPFYRFLYAYNACEGTRHAYNTWDTCDT